MKGLESSPYIGYCKVSVPSSSFGASEKDEAVSLTVGGVSAAFLNDATVTLSAPPNWYSGELRSPSSGPRSASVPHLSEPLFVTMPTHPLYANEDFDVLVFANTALSNTNHNCAGVVCELYQFDIRMTYDASVLSYRGESTSSYYAVPTVTHDASGATVRHTATGLSTDRPSPAYADDRRGMFFLVKYRMRVKGDVSAGVKSSVLGVRVNVFSGSSQLFSEMTPSDSNKDARVLGREDTTATRLTSASIEVVTASTVGVFVRNDVGTGQVFDIAKLTGVHPTADRTYTATGVTDYQRSNLPTDTSVALVSCSLSSGTSVSFTTSSGDCVARFEEDAVSELVTMQAETASHVSSMSFRVVTPGSVSIMLGDSTLHRLAQVADTSGCTSSEAAYQRTGLRVYAEGLDVTSLIGSSQLVTSSAGTVAIVTVSGGTYAGVDYERSFYLQGKSVGTATIRLFDSPSSASVTVSVSDMSVNATSISSKLVTDVQWASPPTLPPYEYPDVDAVAVDVIHQIEE